MTIGYVTIGAHDVEGAVPFFEKTLAPLGYERSYPAPGGAFFGPKGAPPTLEILTPFDGRPPHAGNGVMVALQAQTKEQVRAVHAAALAAGGTDEGAPGYRPTERRAGSTAAISAIRWATSSPCSSGPEAAVERTAAAGVMASMRRLPLALAIVLALAALAFLSAPWFALRATQAAARDGDVQALAELVDYPAVRAGLRGRVQDAALEPAPSVWSDPVGAVTRAIGDQRRGSAEVERRLTPQGLHALAGDPQLFPTVRHWGPNRVRFAVRTEAGESLLTFQRRGWLRWRLAHLAPPPTAAGFRQP